MIERLLADILLVLLLNGVGYGLVLQRRRTKRRLREGDGLPD